MVFLEKSAAYRRVSPLESVPMAKPVLTAPVFLAPMRAFVRSTPGLQPAMTPSVVANRKTLEPDLPFSETSKPVPLVLKTMPVGEPCAGTGLSVGLAGMLTTRGTTWVCGPEVLYNVLVPLPWLATQNGLVGPATSPQA